MKKNILWPVRIALVLAAVSVLSGCAGVPGEKKARLSIVTTVFPEYDWIRNVLGDELPNVSLTMLQDSGVDLHSYQPSAADIVKISTADVFVYTGGESDEWVEDVLKEKTGKSLRAVNLIELLGERARDEETVEGMEEEEDEEAKDEHIWLSLKNAAFLTEALSGVLGEADPEHQKVYRDNAASYIEKIGQLDSEYEKMSDGAAVKTLLFADRFPFLYLVKDYGLSYYAAFSGCSAESEASFETVAFLADKVNELNLPGVFILEGSNGKIAETVKDTAKRDDLKIHKVDSIQSVTAERAKAGETYLSIMQNNLEVFRDALR